MGSTHGEKPRSPQPFMLSVRNAFSGAVFAVRSERNVRIDVSVALLVLSGGIFVGLTTIEWAAVLLCIGIVLSLEVLNSAVERVVDIVSPEFCEPARIAKDVSAGAVLVAAVISVAVGVIIFVPHGLVMASGAPGVSESDLVGGFAFLGLSLMFTAWSVATPLAPLPTMKRSPSECEKS